LGDVITSYIDAFAKCIATFCADTTNREQLQAELTTGKFGIKVVKEYPSGQDEYWRIENGTLYMITLPNYFGSYLYNFDSERLGKTLGKGDALPLNTRKSLQGAAAPIATAIAAASKAFGKELTWIDNYQELYDKLKAAGKSDDYLWELGDPIKAYATQCKDALLEFCKNEDNKQQLETELSTGKCGIRFYVGDDDRYWSIEDGVLWMDTKVNYFGSYLYNFDSERLCGILGKSDPMPLNTRKNLKLATVQIEKDMQAASKLFGKELTWVDNYQEIFDKLKAKGKSQDYLWTLGDYFQQYTKQVVEMFTNFCKDNDNKEALEEVLTSGKVGIKIAPDDKDADDYWVIEDGTLWMETKINYFGSYIYNFDSERLEKKL